MRKYIVLFICVLFVNLLFVLKFNVLADGSANGSYNYDYWADTQASTPGFNLSRTIDIGALKGVYNFGTIADIAVGDNKIFIVDDTGNQVVVLDDNFNFLTRITYLKYSDMRIRSIPDPNNPNQPKQDKLTGPEGAFVAPNGDLYVADTGYRDPKTGAARIVVFHPGKTSTGALFYYIDNNNEDGTNNSIINKPANMIGSSNFVPTKVAVDSSNRIYAIVSGGTEGIVELNPDGSFLRYFGTNEVKVNLIDYFWKSIASSQQKKQMSLTFAPPYNNLAIDHDGFVYTTSSSTSAVNAIERINPSGTNVLLENGYFPPIGDLNFTATTGQSVFTSISVNNYGMYAVADQTHNRVFVYDFDGQLLFILGNSGTSQGEFMQISDAEWLGNDLLVADHTTGLLSVFTPTEFGNLVINATEAYFSGQWDTAGDDWLQALKLNSNYDIAYVGYGRLLYINGDYKDAVKYFELGNNRVYYSLAYKDYRSQYLRDHFLLFISPLVLLILWVGYTEIRYNRKGGSSS